MGNKYIVGKKISGTLPENRDPLYVLYKIPLAQANFLLIQLKKH